MTDLIFILIVLQGLMGAFDTLYHHELKAMLPWKPEASVELMIHSVRNSLYFILFLALAIGEWHGVFALLIILILAIEFVLTLWDFIVEDHTRKLIPSERVIHTVLTINYGIILAYLIPVLFHWYANDTKFLSVTYGLYTYLLLLFATGAFLWALRDGISSLTLDRQTENKLDEKNSKECRTYLVTGGSGFIGRRLCQRLINQGHRVIILTRNFSSTAALFKGRVTLLTSLEELSADTRVDVIINLAGEALASSRWNKKSKDEFIRSRVSMTSAVNRFIQAAQYKPSLLINGSAIGFYGLRGNELVNEHDKGITCYSHELCKQWEQEALKISQLGVRVCLLRTGIVLGRGGGPLDSLLFPFQFGLGGPIGSGDQWMSWVHIDDLINMIFFVVKNDDVSGAINGVSPNPVTNKFFSKTLGRVLRRPVIFFVPPFILRFLIGEMADELLINGQRVIPEKALKRGFQFSYPELEGALKNILCRD